MLLEHWPTNLLSSQIRRVSKGVLEEVLCGSVIEIKSTINDQRHGPVTRHEQAFVKANDLVHSGRRFSIYCTKQDTRGNGHFSPDTSPLDNPPSQLGQFPLVPLKTQLENYIYTYMYTYMHIHIDVCTHVYTHKIHTT